MEYCGGGDLKSFVSQLSFVSEEMARFWTIQIASGLRFLHENNILHRDLKPENLLLPEDRYFIKIGDMGLSTHVED